MLHLTDLFTLPDHKLVEKVKSEKACRACCVRRSEHRALTIGWLAGETADPRGAIGLCHHCADEHSRNELDLWPHLKPDEIMFAVRAHGGQEQARRALFSSDYRRDIERLRRDAA